eukprot:SAG11_NODE_3977_length_2125_cov_2.329714_1_plen_77_part_00
MLVPAMHTTLVNLAPVTRARRSQNVSALIKLTKVQGSSLFLFRESSIFFFKNKIALHTKFNICTMYMWAGAAPPDH